MSHKCQKLLWYKTYVQVVLYVVFFSTTLWTAPLRQDTVATHGQEQNRRMCRGIKCTPCRLSAALYPACRVRADRVEMNGATLGGWVPLNSGHWRTELGNLSARSRIAPTVANIVPSICLMCNPNRSVIHIFPNTITYCFLREYI